MRVPPSGEVEALRDLESHRRRHALYLADPDLRLARQAHPWVVLWDNHDMERDAPEHGGGVRAFREWTPVPSPGGDTSSEQLYRVLRFGDLFDLVVVDMFLFQDRDALPSGAPAVIGSEQEAWLETELRASTAAWRMVGMQKVFAEFGPLSGWQDYDEARSRLISFFEREGIDDNVFLSGDSHFTVWQDVVDHPTAEGARYDPSTGMGAIGGELLATSISRGNFDETLGASATRIIASTRAGFLRDNPHHVDMELTSHGYGIVDVDADRVVGELWYSPILEPAEHETFGGAFAIRRGANRWERTRIETPLAR